MKFLTNLFKSKRKKLEELLKQTHIIRIRTLEEGCNDEIVIIPPVDDDLVDSIHSLLQKGTEVRLEDISFIEDSIQDCKQDICDNPNTYDCPQEILADENTLQDWINQTIATYPRIFILNKILNLLKQYLRTS